MVATSLGWKQDWALDMIDGTTKTVERHRALMRLLLEERSMRVPWLPPLLAHG